MNKIFALVILLTAFFSAEARINPEILKKMKKKTNLSGLRSDCQPSLAQYELEVNNVRARLLAGGDMWWNFQDGRYIVPKPEPGFPEVAAIYAGGVWIGGIDPNGALKLAGVTYRNGNNTDYYSGPLDEEGQTQLDICADWDRHFIVKKENILIHQENYKISVQNGENYDCESIPEDVKYWPARGNPFFEEKYDFALPDQNLAEFFDEDGNGIYNPCNGDYPVLAVRGCDEEIQMPDEIVFWIFNDNGGLHRLSNAIAIQMEVQAQAFAYVTQNELNDMTFYKYKLINKASDDIRDCYFGLWTDPDLGCSEDDYIGCDVSRSMAYVYNEDDVDGFPGSSCGGVNTYGEEIPIIGIDLFRGPRGPKVFCGIDEDGNKILCDPQPGTGEVDTVVELGMTSFTYQNNAGNGAPNPTQDPQMDFEFYNILQGQWRDGTAITYGNSGFDPTSTDITKYVFPDAPNDQNGWSMCTADLPFDDRRMIQGVGPLLLQPGAVNEMIFGVVYVPYANYPCPEIDKLQFADDLAQAAFDNCFAMSEGPDAPDMAGIELDQQLILLLSNDENSNNAQLQYMEKDLMAPPNIADPYYRFEGYQIYQLANANVSTTELNNIEKARVIRQVDLKNGVGEIFNWIPIDNPSSTEPIWIPEKQVAGEDKGIQHSFSIEIDAFSPTLQSLQNGTEYYYTVIAYAYNNYEPFSTITNSGQRTPYLESQNNVRKYAFTPRALDDINIPTSYGQEAAVTRIEGIGTSFNALDMADGEVESILDGSFDGEITYKPGNSPINPRIVNPLGIKDGRYRLEIVGEYNDNTSFDKFIEPGAIWELTDLNTGEVIASHKSIEEINEQIIDERGFSIQVNQVGEPGELFEETNGGIAQVYEYDEENLSEWWNAVPAYEGIEVVSGNGSSEFVFSFSGNDPDDPFDALAQIDEGFFMPFRSAKWEDEQTPYLTPAWKINQGFVLDIPPTRLRLKDLNNVDIVFTSDKSKWSRCVVVETAVPDYAMFGLSTQDNREQFSLRSGNSIDQDGNIIPGETGMSYFPGYAIDVETGERLNIFFGENSVFSDENDAALSQATGMNINTGGIGADMIWNPTSQLFTDNTQEDASVGTYRHLLGGQHYIYVTRQEYDGCTALSELLRDGGLLNTVEALGFVTWTGIPIPKEPLLPLNEGLIPNDLTIKLRVANPFNRELDSPNLKRSALFEAVGGFPLYEFGFEDVEADPVSTEEVPQILDEVVISPNPYHESLATGQSQNEIRISNLPVGAIATIYTFEGKFVRRLNQLSGTSLTKNGTTHELGWDLNDQNGARIASGMYVIHIAVPHLRVHKSLKWIKL